MTFCIRDICVALFLIASVTALSAAVAVGEESLVPGSGVTFTTASGSADSLEIARTKVQQVAEEVTVYVTQEIVKEINGARIVEVVKVPVVETRVVEILVPYWSKLPGDSYRAERINGEKLTGEALTAALKNKPKVILIEAGQTLDDWYRDVLKPETIIITQLAEEESPAP